MSNPNTNSTSTTLKPIIPLVLEKQPTKITDKENYVSFDLKTKAGASKSATYTKYVKLFDQGTPYEWIQLIEVLQEIWTQNSLTSPKDKSAIVTTILRGETLTTFETAISEATTGGDDNQAAVPLSDDIITSALDEVADTIFPFRALDIQKQWMTKVLRKPPTLSIRKTISALQRLNKELPHYPGGDESSKFSDKQLIDILEWAVPEAYREKFLDHGYIPSQHGIKKFLLEGELAEMLLKKETKPRRLTQIKESKKRTYSNNGNQLENQGAKKKSFYCRVHGVNNSHNTAQCKVVQAAKKNGEEVKKPPAKKTTFSSQSFHKELNLLAKKSSKQKVLDQYRQVLDKEQQRLDKLTKKKKVVFMETSDEEESTASTSDDDSFHCIEDVPSPPAASRAFKFLVPSKLGPPKPRVSTLDIASVAKRMPATSKYSSSTAPKHATPPKTNAKVHVTPTVMVTPTKPKSKAQLLCEHKEQQEKALKEASISAVAPSIKSKNKDMIKPSHLRKDCPIYKTAEEIAFLQKIKANSQSS